MPWWAALTVFVLIPAVALMLLEEQGVLDGMLTLLYAFTLFLTPVVVFTVVHRFVQLRSLRLFFVFITAFYYFLTYIFIGYWVFTGGSFDMFFMWDSLSDVPATMRDVLGWKGLSATAFLLALLWVYFFQLSRRVFARAPYVQSLQGKTILALTVFAVATLSQISPVHSFVTAQVSHIQTVQAVRTEEPSVVLRDTLDTSSYKVNSDESLFLLELESGNALALEGRAVVDGIAYQGVHATAMREVAKDGIYFPFFWSTTVQTNRAQAVLLCGVVSNIGDAFSYHPLDLRHRCLPEILREAGYTTVFLSSYWDGGFANTDEFMERAGFDDALFADFMQEDDPRYSWGYDDCTFYDRAFDYLKQKYPNPEKLFVHVVADTNHSPFTAHEKYASEHPFPKPKTFVERYINSAREQDSCITTFYKNFQEYVNTQKTHLFITPDTSWPIGTHGNTYNERNAFNDNFMIPFAYIPSKNRREEFAVGSVSDQRFSQIDFLPTVMEILNKQSYQNSFVPALSALPLDSSHEDCTVLTQPYGGGYIAIVRGNNKYIYSISDRTVTEYDLSSDFMEQNPKVLERDLPYQEFLRGYACERFTEEGGKRVEIWGEPVHLGNETVSLSWVADTAVWAKVLGSGPRKELTIPFTLDPGTAITHVEIAGADMDGGHSFFINGESMGGACGTGNRFWTCTTTLSTPYVVTQSDNVLTIALGDHSGDDLVITEVNFLVSQ